VNLRPAAIKHIFLDDGGVMNDNAVRAPQWQRLVGEYFAPRMGGDPAAWEEANREEITALWERFAIGTDGTEADYERSWREYQLEWLRRMARRVGVPTPTNDDECLRTTLEATRWIIPQVRSAYPGVTDAIRALRDAGYMLHAASGEDEADLHDYLTGMGVRDCFGGTLYGSDIVKAWKQWPRYHAAVVAHSGVDPATALFVDDSTTVIPRIVATGALAVHVSDNPSAVEGVMTIRALAELPALLRKQTASE
jgi:beta-phosphoglucomutase-like phosphatase (HAD superfamily)